MRPPRLEPHASSACAASSSATSNRVTASRGVVACRASGASRSRRSRPIGASIRPDRDRGVPADEREVAALELAPAARAPAAARAPPRSARRRAARRCRGRAGGRCPGRSVLSARGVERRAARARASPSSCPAPGWTTRPAGLSTTSRCSSSTRRRGPSAPAPSATASRSAARRRTSSPPSRRWLFGRRSPSTRRRRPRSGRSASRARADSARAARQRSSRAASGARQRRVANSALAGGRGDRPPRAQQEDRDADDDEGVGEVERRPVARSRKSVTCPSRTRSSRFETLPPIDEAERDGHHGMARARAREEDEHPGDRDRRQRDHDRRRAREEPERDAGVVDVVDRERPRDCTSSPSSSARATTCFVSWSADDGGPRDRREPDPLRARRRERPLGGEIGASPFVDEPTRTSSRGGARAGQARSSRSFRASSMQRSSTARPRAAPAESPCRSRRSAVRAVLDPLRGRPRPRAAGSSRPPRGPSRARGRTSRWRCPRGGCRCSTTRARRPRSSWFAFREVVMLDRRPQPLPLARAARLGSPRRSMSMLIRSPFRPPWRAVARSRPARCRPARRSCLASRRRKRASRSRAARRASRRAARRPPRSRAPLRSRGHAHLPGVTVAADDAGARARRERREAAGGSKPPRLRIVVTRRAGDLAGGSRSARALAASFASSSVSSAERSSDRIRRSSPRAARARRARGASPRGLGVRLGDDQRPPRVRACSRQLVRRALGGDERRAQQLLELLEAARARARAARPCRRGRPGRARRPRSSRRSRRAAGRRPCACSRRTPRSSLTCAGSRRA